MCFKKQKTRFIVPVLSQLQGKSTSQHWPMLIIILLTLKMWYFYAFQAYYLNKLIMKDHVIGSAITARIIPFSYVVSPVCQSWNQQICKHYIEYLKCISLLIRNGGVFYFCWFIKISMKVIYICFVLCACVCESVCSRQKYYRYINCPL